VKNLSFHMDRTGAWSLTPAYDVTFAKGGHWTSSHQMRVADKCAGIRREDLVSVAERFGVKAPGKILDRVGEVLRRWPVYAARTGVPDETVEAIRRELEARRREVG
jgi:serine/threonine-protein kinase HipA